MGRKLSTFWCQLFRSILLYKEKERCLAFSDKNSSLSAKGRAYINLLSVDFAALILSALHIQRCGIILTSLSSFNPLLTVSLDFFIFYFSFLNGNGQRSNLQTYRLSLLHSWAKKLHLFYQQLCDSWWQMTLLIGYPTRKELDSSCCQWYIELQKRASIEHACIGQFSGELNRGVLSIYLKSQ